MRTLVLLAAAVALGCASAGQRPLEMGMLAGSCEDSCRAAADRCDDSSRRREPDSATCAEDLRGCLEKCADLRGGSKGARQMTGGEMFIVSFINLLLGRGPLPTTAP